MPDTETGPPGSPACGENTNTLSRFTLLAQEELVHAASSVSLRAAPPGYDKAAAIKLRSVSHGFEGKACAITATSTVSDGIITAMGEIRPDARALPERWSSACSRIAAPMDARWRPV